MIRLNAKKYNTHTHTYTHTHTQSKTFKIEPNYRTRGVTDNNETVSLVIRKRENVNHCYFLPNSGDTIRSGEGGTED